MREREEPSILVDCRMRTALGPPTPSLSEGYSPTMPIPRGGGGDAAVGLGRAEPLTQGGQVVPSANPSGKPVPDEEEIPASPAPLTREAPSLNPTGSGHAGSAAFCACAPRPWESRGRAWPRGPAPAARSRGSVNAQATAAPWGACALSPPGGQQRNNSRTRGSRFGGRRCQALRRAELEKSFAISHPGADLVVRRTPFSPKASFPIRNKGKGKAATVGSP